MARISAKSKLGRRSRAKLTYLSKKMGAFDGVSWSTEPDLTYRQWRRRAKHYWQKLFPPNNF